MARQRSTRPEDLAIPEDVRADRTWAPIMLEMADHIGAYDTLRIVDAFAGQDVYVPVDPARSPFLAILTPEKAAIFSHVFGRERIAVPTGSIPLGRARRAGIIALIRQKRMTVVEGAAILRMNRRYLSDLVNNSDEGFDAQPTVLPSRRPDPRQLDMFGDEPETVSAT